MMAMYYMWMKSAGDETDHEGCGRGMPIRVVKDISTGNVASHMIPRKLDHWFGIKMLRAEIAYLGHRKWY